MKRFLLVLALFFLVGAVASCGKREQPASQAASKMIVATTIRPVADFVKNVGGEKVAVTVLVPPGASVHAYEPAPGQMSALAKAKVYFMVGSGVEFELAWMGKIKQNNKNLEIVDCSQGIQLLAAIEHKHGGETVGHEHKEKIEGRTDEKSGEHSPGERNDKDHPGKDPHIWLSPRNAQIMVENICAGLVKVDPANRDYYLRNRDRYIRELAALDQKIAASLQKIENKNFLVFHPAWGYFARDYGLKQLPVEVAGKEPSAKDLAALIATAREKNVRVVFASPQFNPQSAAVIAREIGGQVVLIDPLPENYIQNMLMIVDKFR